MSDMTCPTVKIVTPDGYCIINESDFDAEKGHVRFVDPPPAAVVVPAPLAPPPGPVGPFDNLPKDWRNGKTAELMALAERGTGRTPDNKAQAIQMIEAALAAK